MSAIDTDAALASILSNFDSEYINDIVSDSINRKFNPFGSDMPNIVDILDRQFKAVLANSPDYKDEITECKIKTYFEILQIICNYYNLSINFDPYSIDEIELYGITRSMYEVLVSSFTNTIINFFVSYIMQNVDSIVAYINQDPNAKKPKDNQIDPSMFIDSKFILIHANMNYIIYNMASYDIPIDQMFRYIFDQNTSDRLNNLFSDLGDFYKNHFASYIMDPKSTAGLLTNIKLTLQSTTVIAKSNIVE